MKLYALHDKKAKAFTAFQVVRSDAQVSRDFAQAVLDPKSQIGKYAADFELVQLGDVLDEYESVEYLVKNDEVVHSAYRVVLTAQQVLDSQPVRESGDPAQLSVMP